MILKFFIIISMISHAALAAEDRAFDYKNVCGDNYKFCKNINWDHEITCLEASIKHRNLTPECKKEINYALKIKNEIVDACQDIYKLECKEHKPFSIESIKCIKNKTMPPKCSKLVNINFP